MSEKFSCGLVGECKINSIYDHHLLDKIKVHDIVASMFLNNRWEHIVIAERVLDKDLLWICKNCGENEYPKCNKCVREDGKLVEDELVNQWKYRNELL